MRRRNAVRLILLSAAIAAAGSCGGGNPVKVGEAVPTLLKGTVIKGPVKESTVKVFRLADDGTVGAELASTVTDENGAFEARLKPFNGAVVLMATDGTYVEEAIGLEVSLSSNALATFVSDVRAGTTLEGIRLTPVSTLALALTRFHVGKGQAFKAAWEEARTNLNAHFGTLDWASVTPADVTKSTTLSQEGRAGLLLAALSSQARLLAVQSGVSAGLAINAGSLTAALVKDAEFDGTFDGLGAEGQLTLGTQRLDGQTLRLGYSQGLIDFVKSPRNATGLIDADVRSLATRLATADNPYLFCPQQDASKCSTASTDIDAPVITFVSPMEGGAARGSIAFEVKAVDATEVKSLRFETPAPLDTTSATFSADKKSATLAGVFDVSALMDGDVLLRVKAIDSLNNESVKSITIKVSNRGPLVTVSAPSTGQLVNGTLTVIASAMAQSGTVARLEPIGVVPGLDVDSKPEAAAFEARWDTTRLPEGNYTLTLRATDSNGGIGDGVVTIRVDNVPLGSVDVVVSAGAPLAGASVSLVAIDAATGLPPVSMANGGVLGRASMPTDSSGRVTFTLTEENYVGPVQFVAEGTNLLVVDPSDPAPARDGGPALQVAMPGTLKLTSYVSSYRTGDALTGVVTLYTSIADVAARAWALGRNPSSGTPQPLPSALPAVDGFFTGHVSRPSAWQLRTVRPASLVGGQAQALRDTVYAAMPDVALHQLARDISAESALTPGTAVTAFTLTDLLMRDVADGVFNGQASGMSLSTPGTPSYSLDANTSRFRLASALDRFIRGPRNTSTLTRADVQAGGVFDNICNSAPPSNPLYASTPAPLPFDSGAPQVTFTVTFSNGALMDVPPVLVGINSIVAGLLRVEAVGVDDSGMRSITVTRAGAPLTDLPNNTSERYAGTYAPPASGPLAFTARACDMLNNCSNTTVTFLADVAAPVVTVAQPTGQRVRLSAPIDVSATDGAGIDSLVLASGFTGLTDADASAARFQGTWAIPSGQADGTASGTFRACDAVGNCGTTSASVVVDRTPPATLVTVTYSRPPLVMGGAPVGASRLIGGTALVEAVATDPAGLASTSVAVGGTQLMPVAGNTAARFQGTYLTSADGPLTFVASACDSVGNCGDTPSLVAVDNTPPTISVVAPAAGGFFSAAIPLEATAADTAGVASGVWQNQAGFSWADQDGTAPRMFGSLAIGAGAAEGPGSGAVEFCDTVANCRTQSVAFSVDRLAPVIAVTSPPAAFTNGNSVSLSVTASDGAGAGVGTVYARAGGNPPVAGVRSGATWSWNSLSLPTTSGSIAITIYGVDTATGPNSGETRSAPYLQTATILRDTGAPVANLAPYLSWQDEDTLGIQLDGTGIPVMPVVYQPSGATRTVNVTPLTPSIKRAVTRLNDTGNRPVLSVSLPFLAGTDAPITSATWSSTRPCAFGGGCTPAIGGPLTAVARGGANTVYYDLPLLLPESGTYDITLSFTDAAGNSGTLVQRLTWELVGPPLAIVRDTAWDSFLDPQSVRAASIASRTYHRFYGGSPQPTGSRARVARYLVYNPAPEAVSVGFDVYTNTRTNAENWTDVVGDQWQGSQGTFTADGFSYRKMEWFNLDNTTPADFCSNTNELSYTRPCPDAPNGAYMRIRHRRGNTLVPWECYGDEMNDNGPRNGRVNNYSFLGGDLAGQYFTSPATIGSGNEVTVSQEARFTTPLSHFGGVVPAASGSTPGVVAAYLTTSSTASRPADVVNLSTAPLPNLGGTDYKLYFADAFHRNQSVEWPDGPNGAFCNGFSGLITYPHRALYWYRRLTSATTTLGAAFRVMSGGGLIQRTNPFPTYTFQQSTVTNRLVHPGLSVTSTVTH